MTVTTCAEAAEKVLPLLQAEAARTDAQAAFPEAGLQALRESGLLGLLVPEEYGGMGGDLTDLVDVAGLLAGGCLSTAMIWAMHCQQSDAVVRFASPELKSWLLPRIARGEVYLASVTTEPGKGGHLLTGKAPLQHEEGLLTLRRDAPVITGGRHADGFLITMRASPEAADNQVSLVYADREQLELVERGEWDTLGMRGTESLGFTISGSVPAFQTVGEAGEFQRIAVESMAAVGHLAWAACWLGAGRAALQGLVGLVRSADRPGSIDVRSELVNERLARIRMDLELVSAYLRRVLDEVTQLRAAGQSLVQTPVQIHLNTLKVTAAELTFQAVDRMVQLAGLRFGYHRQSPLPLERTLRDLRSASLNYANDRLLVANGALTLMDRSVRLA
ncbi:MULTISPECIES: acyl-CoA dehydrogenase family protein [Streptomyces]|uniref:acyl-CoA dehydrogenase family protein n=1 Tax=Streptomyces TaxID=1883 RepID=UPI00094A55F9|nr:acyl-CoA dehydrogenase family protein [Streptomyces sp. Tue 6075]APS20092.1 acyl-CoA dehydrogenase [Streptomyces sp. Tue 6075]